MITQLRRAAEEARAGGDWQGMGGVFLLLTPEQGEMFMRMQALMSLLEGHASFVMNKVARDHVDDVDRMRRALSAGRRRLQRRAGLPEGDRVRTERSVSTIPVSGSSARDRESRRHVHVQPGVEESVGDLPTLEEIGEPERWLARIGG